VLYYLRERKTGKNLELRYLIITNIYEWFVFDARNFEDVFGNNKMLEKQFTEFENKTSVAKTTDTFYKEIAAPAIEKTLDKIEYTHFDIRDYDQILRNADKEDDRKLIALYKFLSPIHLLKQPFANDANELNKEFYAELLHILGLEEVKDGGQKFIVRKKEGSRDSGSIIENAIEMIDRQDKLQHLNAGQYGKTKEEQLFSVALDLSITWINRLLFLKLLEAQIIKYHNLPPTPSKGGGGSHISGGLRGADFAFLSIDKLSDYDDLDSLFFEILARKEEERRGELKTKFSYVPYLNSSLFEKTEIEDNTIFISSLQDNIKINLYSKSVLAPSNSPKGGEQFPPFGGIKGGLRPLEYLLRFLDAYDFSNDSSEDIQEENKQLISASVLGLIFEKINGYKDGSFFTPSFITMYMCRETISKTVIQKFNETKKWNCQNIDDVSNHIGTNSEEIKEANKIFNSIRICDPAVGSGHFLVSALNEMLWLKSKLGILADENGKKLKGYQIEIANDELIITDDENNYFSYNPSSVESQRVQEILFREKQSIIENCLFGVDINPNSVKICQLRLWIELLKHTYYRKDTKELETLPNIDINIKCGNSLISRFDLTGNYSSMPPAIAQNLRIATQQYKDQVIIYKCTDDKAVKKQTRDKIAQIKETFSQINNPSDKDYKQWKDAENSVNEHFITMWADEDKDASKLRLEQLQTQAKALQEKYEQKIKSTYANAFEWSFEFPEVLDDDGNFIGFDAIIGNPPYISAPAMVATNQESRNAIIQSKRYSTLFQKWDLYIPFIEIGIQLLHTNGIFSMIVPYPFTNQTYGKKLRELIIDEYNLIELVDLNGTKVFEHATVSNCIPIISKSQPGESCFISHINEQQQITRVFSQSYSDLVQDENTLVWNLTTEQRNANRHSEMSILGDFCYISVGMVLNADEKTAKGEFTKDELIGEIYDEVHCRKYIEAKDIGRYQVKKIHYLEYNTERCPNKLRRPTFKELYNPNKLMMNCLGTINAALDENQQFLHNHSLYCAILWQDLKGIENKSISASVKRYSRYSRGEMEISSIGIDLRYLLGVLNSKYASVLLSTLRGGDYHIYPEHLRNLPIPNISLEQQQPIIALVEQILSAKKENSSADTSVLEKEIDRLVYELYGLDDKEIKIIEKQQ
jgi:hypothetical protein